MLTLQQALQVEAAAEVNSRNKHLSVPEMNCARRMKHLMDQLPILKQTGVRLNQNYMMKVHNSYKAVLMNKLTQIITDQFISVVQKYQQRLLDFQIKLSQLSLQSKFETFESTNFMHTVLSQLLPISSAFCVARNTKFIDFNFANYKTDKGKIDRLFNIFEHQHTDDYEHFSYLLADCQVMSLVKDHLRCSSQKGYCSIMFQINQSVNITETKVLFLFECEKTQKDLLNQLLTYSKLNSLIRDYCNLLFITLYKHSEGKLDSTKLKAKCNKFHDMLLINSVQILQATMIHTSNISMKSRSTEQLKPSLVNRDPNNNYLTVKPTCFNADICFLNYDSSQLPSKELSLVTAKIDKFLCSFKEKLERSFNRSFKRRVQGTNQVLFELDSELRLTNVEFGTIDSVELLSGMGEYKMGIPLSEYVSDTSFYESLEEKFSEQLDRVDAPASYSFLFGSLKLTIGFLTLIEGTTTENGNRYFLLVSKAPQNEHRICFDFGEQAVEAAVREQLIEEEQQTSENETLAQTE